MAEARTHSLEDQSPLGHASGGLAASPMVRPCDQKMRSTGVENIDPLAFAGWI